MHKPSSAGIAGFSPRGDVGSLCTLRELRNATLSGSISPSLGNLTELSDLDLSYNNLTGFYPEPLVACQFLTVLNLAGNHLEGTLPDAPPYGASSFGYYETFELAYRLRKV
eukprot:SM000099S25198  [mRNA]  locus=s99:38550:42615:- [translate_table: standard]